MTLVDSNVLIDVAADDAQWFDWSIEQIARARRDGPLLINDVIFAESSIRYRQISDCENFLERVGGTKTGVLPDFFIGAHAVVSRLPLLTRDIRRYRTYFPAINLIAPDTDPH